MGIHMFAGYTGVDAVAELWMMLMAEAETLLSSLPVLGGDRNYEAIPQLVHGLRKHNEEYNSVVEWYRSSLTQWAELGVQLSSRRDGVPEGTYDMDIMCFLNNILIRKKLFLQWKEKKAMSTQSERNITPRKLTVLSSVARKLKCFFSRIRLVWAVESSMRGKIG